MKTLNESADISFQIINVRLKKRVRQKQKIIRINKNIIVLNDEQLQHVVHFSVYVVIPKCFKLQLLHLIQPVIMNCFYTHKHLMV